MKYFAPIIFLAFTAFQSMAQSLYFPPLVGDEWDTISPASLGWCEDDIPALYDYLDSKNTKAFLVLKDGKIVLEKYFDTFTNDSLWYWASAGKTITSVLTGIAQTEGLLSIDDPTSDYLGTGWTSCTPEQEAAITIRNQLSMTSGLDDGVEVHCTEPECLHYLADAGERWAYHNGPYTLLGDVISEASGMTFNGFCNTRLEAQTGMSGGFVTLGENTVYFSQPRDMARFGLMVLNEGYWETEPVLADAEYFNNMVNTSQDLNLAYGYLWWLNGKSSFMVPQSETVFDGSMIPNAPDDMFAALGKNDQILNVVPSQNLIVVRMGENPGGIEDLVPTAHNNIIWNYLNGIMCEVSEVENNTTEKLKIYPNPTSDLLTIINDKRGDYSVFSSTGERITSGKLTGEQQTLDVSGYENGLYFLRIATENGIQNVKFIVH
jgi:CubicO group peptidase (beta-lactamase class C family)